MSNKKRALWSLVVLGAALVGVHTARSEPTVKVWKDGDRLTAADLNANFMAAQPAAATAAPYVWTAFKRADQDTGMPSVDGRVATFSFSSPVDGFALVSASYEIRIRNQFDSTRLNCGVASLLSDTTGFTGCALGESCQIEGFAQSSINGNLPTQDGGGTYLGLAQNVSRVLPIKRGTNTFFLNGRHDCAAAVWGALQFNAIFVQAPMAASITLP